MEPFIGEIRLFAGTYAPRGWVFCNGQPLSIAQNQALYAIIGTTYGGDGKTTFNLPNLQGKAAINMGTGPNLTSRVIGQNYGAKEVPLTANNLPLHGHIPFCQSVANSMTPDETLWATTPARGGVPVYTNTTPDVPMNAEVVQATGGSSSHNNMQPYLGLNFIIAVQGLFPSRG